MDIKIYAKIYNNNIMSSQSYLAAIQELILQNETIKSSNRQLKSRCEDLLDQIVDMFSQFFPSIRRYDTDSIHKACEEICPYYKKQLLIIKSELCTNLLQLINLYEIQVDDGIDNVGFDNWRQFLQIMKEAKGGVIQQLGKIRIQNERIQELKNKLEKDSNLKQLEIRRLNIDLLQKQTEIHRLVNQGELLSLQIKNSTKQLARVTDEYQSMKIQFNSNQNQMNSLKNTCEELRRCIFFLQRQRVEKAFQNQSKI